MDSVSSPVRADSPRTLRRIFVRVPHSSHAWGAHGVCSRCGATRDGLGEQSARPCPHDPLAAVAELRAALVVTGQEVQHVKGRSEARLPDATLGWGPDDRVVLTGLRGAADPTPPGWIRLEAGPTRQIRVNRNFCMGYEGELPFHLGGDDYPVRQVREVRPLGRVRYVIDEHVVPVGCSAQRSIWMATEAAILVRE